jgi:uncharacterized protein involved in outer membrane biogenesis
MEPRTATTEVKTSDKRAGKARKVALILVAAVALYGLIGAVIVPPIAKKVMTSQLGERLGRVVEIDKVSANPYTLRAAVHGMRILEADRKSVFAEFARLDVDGSIVSLRRLAPVIDRMDVDGLKVRLVRDGENHYNLSDILERLAAQSKSKDKDDEPARFSVSNIHLARARIDFDDKPLGTKHEVTDIDLAVPFVSSLPRHLKQYVQPALTMKVNGAPVEIRGETLPFEDSLRTHVALDVKGFDLPRYMGYSPTPLPVKLATGKLDGRIQVRFTQATAKQAAIDISGDLAASGLQVDGDGGELARVGNVQVHIASFDPLGGKGVISSLRVDDARAGEPLRVAAVEADGIHVDLHGREIRIDSVATRGGDLALRRAADGSLEMPVKLPQAPAAAEASQPAASVEPAAPWRLAVTRATVDDYKVALHDEAVRPAAQHRVSITHVEARDLSSEKGAKSTVLAKLGTDKGGSIDVESTVALDPLLVDAKLDARRIDLVPLRPYAQYFKTVKLKSGLASARGRLQLRSVGDTLKVAYAGSAEVAKLATFETTSKEELLSWESVKVDGMALKLAADEPVQVSIRDIAVDRAYSRVVVTPEGRINLQQLKLATDDDPEPAPEDPEDLKPRNVRIDRVSFADSRLNFTDHFIKPNYTADVGELNGTVTGLSSDPASRGVVDLKGRYDKSSAVVIAGRINPLSGSLFLDIAAKGSDIELPALSAYSMRYAGYPIKSGKLTLDVKYHVEDGKLDGRNKIRLDQLTFGDKVESPEATTLPVLFAVNLLKDSQGRIDLELPIKGSLDDPQFDLGALIGQVVGNLLKKAVTAPFQLLAAAFGGESGAKSGAPAGDDLAYVAFKPGTAEVDAAQQAKLERISRALQQRPALKLEMAGHVDPKGDLAALRDQVAGPVDEGALEALAARRADWVKTWLTAKGGLPAERVLVASGDAGTSGARMSRVDFTLK